MIHRMRRLIALTILVQLVINVVWVPAPANAQGTKPNFIVIMLDDLDPSPETLATMTKMQQLIANQGMTFSNAIAPYTLCCPSRVSYLTGTYAHNHDVVANAGVDGGFEKFYAGNGEQNTIATQLQAIGYRTIHIGKYLNGYPGTRGRYIPPGWTEWFGTMGGMAFYDYSMNENGTIVNYGSTPNDYLTDVMIRHATGAIQRAAQGSAPFFINIPILAPHGPAEPAPRHLQLFPGIQAPRPPNFNEADVSDKPAYIRTLPLLTATEIAAIDRLYGKRVRSIQAADELINAVVQKLTETGKLNNTYIIFTSDHGFHQGNHRRDNGKYTPYEESVRVPMIIRGPGVPHINRTQPVSNIDLLPTFLQLAGSSTNLNQYDGRSLVPLLQTNQANVTWRGAIYSEKINKSKNPLPVTADMGIEDFNVIAGDITLAAEGDTNASPYSFFRTATLKYVEYSTGEREIYNLSNDPYELNNLINTTPANQVAEYAAALAKFKTCSGNTCRQADSYQGVVVPTPTPTPTPTSVSLPRLLSRWFTTQSDANQDNTFNILDFILEFTR